MKSESVCGLQKADKEAINAGPQSPRSTGARQKPVTSSNTAFPLSRKAGAVRPEKGKNRVPQETAAYQREEAGQETANVPLLDGPGTVVTVAAADTQPAAKRRKTTAGPVPQARCEVGMLPTAPVAVDGSAVASPHTEQGCNKAAGAVPDLAIPTADASGDSDATEGVASGRRLPARRLRRTAKPAAGPDCIDPADREGVRAAATRAEPPGSESDHEMEDADGAGPSGKRRRHRRGSKRPTFLNPGVWTDGSHNMSSHRLQCAQAPHHARNT